MSKRYYTAEVRTPQNKIETVEGWYDERMTTAIGEIEKEMRRGCRLKSIERMSAKGRKE